MKKLLLKSALALASLMASASASAHDFEVDGIFYNITSDTDNTVEVTYKGDSYYSYSNEYTGAVTIPSSVTYSGTTYSVTSIGDNAFYGCTGLTSVTIPNSVTEIGSHAFKGCTGLTSVTIPNSVTSIGNSAFYGCTGLTSMTIPNSVTKIGINAFCDCSGLTTIVVDKENSIYDSRENCNAIIETSTNSLIVGCKNTIIPNSVITIGDNAFCKCTGLISVDIPNSVTSIGYFAFYGCTGLTSVTIPNSVTKIGDNAFQGCDMTELNFNAENCTLGGEVFDKCRLLKTINIGDNVKIIPANAFSGCDGLTEVNITDLSAWCKIVFENSFANPLSYAGHLKLNGTEITNLVIPDDINGINAYAFYGCSGLTSVTIPNSVTEIGEDAFRGCSSLTSVTIPNSVTEIGENAFYRCSDLTSVTIPNSVTSIGNSAFYGCSGLTSVTISNSVTEIGNYVFSECSGLTSVTIPNSVTSIGFLAFQNCSGLTSVTIPNSVTSIGYLAFYGCTGLTSVTIPNSVTIISLNPFTGCSNLSEIIVATDNPYYDSRDNCNAIIETNSNQIIAGCKNTIIPNSVTEIGSYAFCDCTGMTSVTIPNSVTSISNSAFYGCTGLTSVTIPNSVTKIGDNAFQGCSALTSLTIPHTITDIGCDALHNTGWYNIQPDGILYLDKCCLGYKGAKPTGDLNLLDDTHLIADYAFKDCSGLTSVNFGNSLKKIGDEAFYWCTALTDITIEGSTTELDKDVFYKTGWFNNQPDGILYLDRYCIGYKGSRPKGTLVLKDDTRCIVGNAFQYCGFTTVVIPDSVAIIGKEAFAMCHALSTITIPKSVRKIGENAFRNCKLTTVTSLNPTPPSCDAFYFVTYKATLYVPKDAFAAYFLDEVWGQFANIKKIETLADSISLSNETLYLNIGDTHTLNSEIIPAEATVPTICWTSDNPLVATVDPYGVVTGVSKGRAAITARAMDGSEVYSTCMVSVEVATSITLSQTEASLPVNDLMTLSYTILPDELTEKTATWSTSNPGVAGFKENADGSISIVGVSNGVATITATTTDGSNLSASCLIKVGTVGIDGIESDDNITEVARYDIHGRLLNEPTPGINIVKMSNGATRKEIIK